MPMDTIGRSCGSATVDRGDERMWLKVGRWRWLKLGGVPLYRCEGF